MWFWKKTAVPVTNEVTQVQSLQMWSVRWKSQRGKYPYNKLRDEAEFFTSEELATYFANSLRAAFVLVRHDSYSHVEVCKEDGLGPASDSLPERCIS